MPARHSLVTRALILLAAGACLVALLALIHRAPESHPFADSATTSIYTLRVVNGDLATGAYSRFHWNHPGPLLYQILAPLYAMSGRHEMSLKWTMLLLNITVLAALLLYLRRRSPWLSATAALALLPLLLFEQRLLFWAWNPVAPLLSLALAVALAAGVCAGDLAALPWLCVVVSFLVQSHVGLAPVSLLLAGAAVASALWRTCRSGLAADHRALTRAVAISTVVAALLWAAPLIHDLGAQTGNLADIARFFVTHHERHAWPEATRVFANELVAGFNPARELITGDMPVSATAATRAWAAVQLLLLALASAWSYRRGRAFDAAFALLCLLASLTGLFAIRSIVGDISDYLVIWVGIIGILNVAALLAVVGRTWHACAITPAFDLRSRAAIAVFVATVTLMGAMRLSSKQQMDARDVTLPRLAVALGDYCDQHGLVRPTVTFDWKIWRAGTGLILQFYKSDRAVAVADDVRYVFGEPFARTSRETAEFYLMATEDTAMPTGVTRFTWITTVSGYRLVRVFRD